MIPFLKKNTKPANPILYLCKPDRTTIGKIKYADKISFSLKAGTQLSELNFTVHKKIKWKDKWQRYPLFDLMKIKFLIRAVNAWGTEYYVIDHPSINNENETVQVHAFLLPYQLQDKKFYSYDTTDSDGNDSPVTIESVLTTALSVSYAWKIGHIDDSLKSKYRSFSVDDTTALDFIQQICDKFNATVAWDTVNRLVNIYDIDTYFGQDKRFYITEKKYLKSLEKDVDPDNLVTRLHCFGADDISLNSVNPTGQDYVEDYTYFIDNYKRDSSGNIISHSSWMSDSLCQSLLDYKKLTEDNTDKFKNYLSQLNSYQTNLVTLQSELISLNTDLSIINDSITVNSSAGCYFNTTKVYNGTGWAYQAPLNDFQHYIIMCKSSNPVTAKIDDNSYLLNSSWKVIKKTNQDATNFVITSGQNTSEVTIAITLITNDEYSASGNESTLLEKYNKYNKQNEITAKTSEINQCKASITATQNSITSLQSLLSPQNNFTPEQLNEWDNFIKEDTFSSSDYIDPNDLMTDGKKELVKRQQPTSTFNISITNFLQVVECQTDWEKLILNDIVTIIYDNGVKIKANISEIDIDFDSGSISLQITNTKEQPRSLEQQFTDIYKKTIQSATSLNKNKPSWNSAQYTRKSLDTFLNGSISANTQNIVGGLNETEIIDELGYKSVFDEQSYTRIYRGCIVSTNDGGQSWNLLFSPKGVNAEQIIGELMLDSQTAIRSTTGNIHLTNQKSILDGSATQIINGGLPSSQINDDLVTRANLGSEAKNQIDNLEIGTVNLVSRNNYFGSVTEISSSIGHSDYALTLNYDQPNGFVIPVRYASWITVSFLAYANMDNIPLYMSFDTSEQTDEQSQNVVTVGTNTQLYQWTMYYNNENMLTKDNLLKFWHVNYGGTIVLLDIQLENGKVKSAYKDATF